MHVLIAANTASDVDALLDAASMRWPEGKGAIEALAAEWRRRPEAFSLVRAVIDRVPHREGAAYRDLFEAAASIAPDAASALYTLGDDALLEAATAEVAGWARMVLTSMGRRDAVLLDLGCGSGRLLAALTNDVGFALGLDIAEGMVKAAGQRLGKQRDVALLRTNGKDLACLGDRRVDLVLAADVFPYLTDRAAMLNEIARVLRPQGRCLLLNFGYEAGAAAHLPEMAAAARLELEPVAAPLRHWDAERFILTLA